MARIVDALGARAEDVVAFGDGLNDVEMLEYAGAGVAIEGSAAPVLAAADRTAAPPAEQGLVAALAELGLTAITAHPMP